MTAHIWAADQPFFMSGGAPIPVTPPTVTPANPTLASLLTVNLGTLDHAETTTVQWLLAGAPIPGEVGLTLSAALLALGNIITAQVTATSITGKTTVQVSAPVTISL